jgi:hypothetical protein
MAHAVALTKQTIKFLAVCKDPRTYRQVIRSASDSVITIICDAALNAFSGDVQLTNEQVSLFHKYRDPILYLIEKGKSPTSKRAKLLSTKKHEDSYRFIPQLLTTVLQSLGSALITN